MLRSIEAKSDVESVDEVAFTELVAFLGLRKCALSEHASLFDQT